MTPIGHVLAPDKERHKIVGCGLRIGLLYTVDEADIFSDHNGKLVPNEATGVPKMKRLPGGSTVELNACYRRLRSHLSLLPPVSRLGFNVLDEGKTLETDLGRHGVSFCWCKKKSLAQCTSVVILTNGSMWLSPLFPWAGSARWTSFNILLFFDGIFPTPPSLRPGLHGWLGCGHLVKCSSTSPLLQDKQTWTHRRGLQERDVCTLLLTKPVLGLPDWTRSGYRGVGDIRPACLFPLAKSKCFLDSGVRRRCKVEHSCMRRVLDCSPSTRWPGAALLGQSER